MGGLLYRSGRSKVSTFRGGGREAKGSELFVRSKSKTAEVSVGRVERFDRRDCPGSRRRRLYHRFQYTLEPGFMVTKFANLGLQKVAGMVVRGLLWPWSQLIVIVTTDSFRFRLMRPRLTTTCKTRKSHLLLVEARMDYADRSLFSHACHLEPWYAWGKDNPNQYWRGKSKVFCKAAVLMDSDGI